MKSGLKFTAAAACLLAVSACGDSGGGATTGETVGDPGGDVSAAEEDGGPVTADEPDVVGATGGEADADGATDDAGPTDDAGEPDAELPSGPLQVSDQACCLGADGDLIVWADGGDLWVHDAALGATQVVVDHAAVQKDVTISGTRLVWSDDRDGGFDLWTMDLDVGVAEPLVTGPGDQDQAWLDGDLLVWIGRETPPHTSKEGNVWFMDLSEADPSPAMLTDDLSEQAYPHAQGGRVVWTDFSADPDGVYLPIDDPSENNGDILGFDLATGAAFVVTQDLSKQLRPAIHGTNVVWLDWRGINPEPKYSEFQIYATELGTGVETFVAWSAWQQPALWRRPAILEEQIAFIADPGEQDLQSGVFTSTVSGAQPELVVALPGFLESVVIRPGGGVAWLGGGELGLAGE